MAAPSRGTNLGKAQPGLTEPFRFRLVVDFLSGSGKMESVGAGNSVGVQIRRLREQAGLAVPALAKAAGLEAGVVREIESCDRDFQTEEVYAIAESLQVSPMAIFKPDSLLGRLPVATRTNGDESSCATARNLLTSLAELHYALSSHEHHDMTPSAIGQAPRRRSSTTWLQHANQLAEWAVTQFGLTINGNNRLGTLAAAVEQCLGVDVMVEANGADAPLGASIADPEFAIILVNADQPTPQALFTLAHELGHVLSQDGGLFIDKTLRGATDSERSANAFASTLLMPESDIREAIDAHGCNAKSLAHMLIRFEVSYESLVYRLHNLKIINAHGRDQLQTAGWSSLVHALGDTAHSKRLLSARGTRPERRPPGLLVERCWRGVLTGYISARPLAGLLDLDVDDLIENIESVGSESIDAMNGDYSSPIDSDEATRLGFDADPVAA